MGFAIALTRGFPKTAPHPQATPRARLSGMVAGPNQYVYLRGGGRVTTGTCYQN
jgi:hypothetical protein